MYASVLLIVGIALSSLCMGAVRSEKAPRILIIGDSISIGFTPFVKEMFQGRAEVFHNPGNARSIQEPAWRGSSFGLAMKTGTSYTLIGACGTCAIVIRTARTREIETRKGEH